MRRALGDGAREAEKGGDDVGGGDNERGVDNVECGDNVSDLPHNSIESPPACAAAPLLLPGSALASQDSLTPSAGLLGLVVSNRF